MYALVASLLAVLGFFGAFLYLEVIRVSKAALANSRSGVSAMLDNHLSDEEKEAAVQAAGLSLLHAGMQVFWRLSVSFLVAAVPIFFADLTGLVSVDAVMTLMLRWDFLVGTTVFLVAVSWYLSRGHAKQKPESAYSAADQFVHRLAFSGGVQLAAAEIEDRLFARSIREAVVQPPIFVTSLPRAGTTVLLSALNDIPGTACHSYRDMPLVMAPLLWNRISGPFRKRGSEAERAHGDGIRISYDSPEAFEEVLWQAFWPKKYRERSIDLWHADDELPEARHFFHQHFAKMVALRADGRGRYVSKNNNNIARLDLLQKMFPGAHVVVPIREPAQHVGSLLRQHRNFLRRQIADPFVERYMHDIGHFEFGRLHKPFEFESFKPKGRTPDDPQYWLDYWIAAYSEVLVRADRLHLVSQHELAENPGRVLNALRERIGFETSTVEFAPDDRPVVGQANTGQLSVTRMKEAENIYRALLDRRAH